MEKTDKLQEVVDKVRLAFMSSSHRGSMFFASILLPAEDEEIVEHNFASLITAFNSRPEQLPAVRSIVDDLRYLRGRLLADPEAKEILQKVAEEVVKEAAEYKAISEIVNER